MILLGIQFLLFFLGRPVDHDKGSERSKRANVRDGEKHGLSVAGPLEMKHLQM